MSTRKVLYVDDNEDHIKLVEEKIDKIVEEKIKKIKIATVYDIIGETYGDKAIDIIKNDKDMNIKAMILDKQLLYPGTNDTQEIQGEEVYDAVKKSIPSMPIIVLSEYEGSDKPTEGCFRKEKLFKSAEQFKKLEKILEESIFKREAIEYSEYYPRDGGNMMWKRRWGPEYVEFRKSPDFSQKEAEIGKLAEEDYYLLDNKKLQKMTYRDYRGPNSIWDVLINRRVIFARIYLHCHGDNDNINKFGLESLKQKKGDKEVVVATNYAYQQTNIDLGFKEYNAENLREFMFKCGIIPGNIQNNSTKLEEEMVWLDAFFKRI